MTDNVLQFPTWLREDHFGVCPICHSQNGFRSLGRDHWVICNRHQVKWYVGSNLFSSWRDETAEERFASRDLLARYQEITPYCDIGWQQRMDAHKAASRPANEQCPF